MSKIVEDTQPCNLLAIDECSITLNSDLRKVVAKRGSRPEIRTERTYSRGITVIAAIRGNQELIWQIQEERGNSSTFGQFLKYIRSSITHGKVHTVIDNAKFHKTKGIQEMTDELEIQMHFQPPHSPFHNAAEEIWRQLREFLRGRLFFNLQGLKEAIIEFFIFNPKLNINVARYLT